MARPGILLFSGLILWGILYAGLQPAADFLTVTVLNLEPGTHFAESFRFFIFEVPKVLLLLVLILFFVGIIRSYFPAEKTRKLLEGKPAFTGNLLAGLLGIVTPFCSCSAIPLFIGFIEAGIPLGVTFSFLIAAPMINEVAVVLLIGLFGWKIAAIYVATGLSIAVSSGWIIGRLTLEKYVADWVYQVQTGVQDETEIRLSFQDRMRAGLTSVQEVLSKVWLYLVLGVGVGAAVHGYAPEDLLADIMGQNSWYSVPLSVLIGIPLYSNAAGILPVVSVLIEKGVPIGTALAFMMSVIGLSLPELVILKKVLKVKMLFIFAGIVGTGILIVGLLLNSLI